MIGQESLFEDPREVQVAKLDAVILNLIMGHPGGPFSQSLDKGDREVLRVIRYKRGLENAISIREISAATNLDARSIKQSVRTLRMTFRLPIGSTKRATEGGYFLMLSDVDRAAWSKDVLDQVRAEFAVLHAALGQQASLEVLGQLRMEMESTS